jgi:hypothetical protein
VRSEAEIRDRFDAEVAACRRLIDAGADLGGPEGRIVSACSDQAYGEVQGLGYALGLTEREVEDLIFGADIEADLRAGRG